jgi:hypothetical protein
LYRRWPHEATGPRQLAAWQRREDRRSGGQEQTLGLLDELAKSPSVLGIAAKCLRVRMVLRFGE